ncbi:NADP-dependent oxidoreductase [Corynebacterium terpenotabidum]|uniref:Putative NADPH:quinone reductase n=1 Tax=Corynebacterium terpenotabidum Y-11 TaxID=1200352 RepID=S4XIP4_9CORY|nr:NADP-dependent oxidoreductase [Corynebacterium terpenotabidum]AGP30458.1 putative NADPH:quinone reductase [Corynebacterium terpenotabidum Y-11]
MRIFGFESYGGPEVAGFLDVPTPDPASVPDCRVLIATTVAAVNPADIKVRSGERQGSFPVRFPMAMGREASGIVLAADPVSGISPGMAVFGSTASGTGAFADQIYLDAVGVTPVPDGVTPAQAACLPVAAGTAWDILHELRRDGLTPGSTVLVLGAGGGVGHCAVQLAAALGYRVTGVAGAGKRAFVESLGATSVPSGEHWTTDVRDAGPVDAVIDLVGGDVLVDALGLTSGPVRSVADPAVGGGVTRRRTRAVFSELAGLIADGTFTPHITASLPFPEAADAVARVEGGHATGKTVIRF